MRPHNALIISFLLDIKFHSLHSYCLPRCTRLQPPTHVRPYWAVDFIFKYFTAGAGLGYVLVVEISRQSKEYETANLKVMMMMIMMLVELFTTATPTFHVRVLDTTNLRYGFYTLFYRRFHGFSLHNLTRMAFSRWSSKQYLATADLIISLSLLTHIEPSPACLSILPSNKAYISGFIAVFFTLSIFRHYGRRRSLQNLSDGGSRGRSARYTVSDVVGDAIHALSPRPPSPCNSCLLWYDFADISIISRWGPGHDWRGEGNIERALNLSCGENAMAEFSACFALREYHLRAEAVVTKHTSAIMANARRGSFIWGWAKVSKRACSLLHTLNYLI